MNSWSQVTFSSFWPSFPFLTFLLPRPFDLGPLFTALVLFVILVWRFLLMLFSRHRRISRIKRLTRRITDRQSWQIYHKKESNSSNDLKYLRGRVCRNLSRDRQSRSHDLPEPLPICLRHALHYSCAANRRYLAYFLLFMSFYEFWSSKKNHNMPNYYSSLSLIFGFEVDVGIFSRMVVVCRYSIWALSLLFDPCGLSEFTLAGPQVRYGFAFKGVYFRRSYFFIIINTDINKSPSQCL